MGDVKLVFELVEDSHGMALYLNGGMCKAQTFKGMEHEGVTPEHVIGRWVLQEIKPYGGVLKL